MTRLRHTALLALATCAVTLAAGCKRSGPRDAPAGAEDAAGPQTTPEAAAAGAAVVTSGPEQVVVTGISVHTIDPDEVREIYPRQLARLLGRELVGSGLFAGDARDVPAGHVPRPAGLDVRIHYDVVEDGSAGGPAAVVAIDSAFAWEDPAARDPAPYTSLLAERGLARGRSGEDLDGITAALARTAIERLAGQLVARERVRTGGEAALAEALAGPEPRGEALVEPEAIVWALDLVAHRQPGALFDRVVAQLDARAPEVRERAVAALARMGDPRAVAALTGRVRFDDTELLPSVIDAVAALGGDEARAYLEFVASGHPDDAIRARARAALSPAP